MDDQHKFPGGRVLSIRVALQVSAAFCLVILPLSGYCASGADSISKIFGSNMNDVAVKVAELPKVDEEELVDGLDFSPDGNYVAVDSNNLKINIWDWRKKIVVRTVEKPHGGNNLDATNPIRYSPDGHFLAACEVSGAGDVVVRIWNTENWSIATDIVAGTGIEGGSCKGMGFTPDGRQFVRTADSHGKGNNLIIYAVGTWQPVWGLPIENFSVASVAISLDGEIAAIGGVLTVVPWELKDPIERVQHLSYRPQIHLINLQQRKVVKIIEAGTNGPIAWSPHGMAWSPDGTRLGLAFGGGGVDILDSHSGENLLHVKLEKSGHMNVQYSHDGRYLIACDMNGRGTGLGVKIWDAERHQLLQEIHGDVGNISISRDSKYLAVGIPNHISIWQLK